jgi:hypothetical protein
LQSSLFVTTHEPSSRQQAPGMADAVATMTP